MTTALDEALRAASRGWSVIQVKPRDKTSLGSWKERQRVRATNEETEAAFHANPGAGLGFVTGAISGLVVLDIDPDSGGKQSMNDLVQQFGAMPQTPAVRTGGGGFHYYFEYPEAGLRNSAGKLGNGLDIRGDGGYVVAPPSIHPNGNRYDWAKGRSPDDIPLAPLPTWVIARLSSTLTIQQAIAEDAIPEGKRHATLLSLGGAMVSKGMSAEAVEAALLAENEKRCEPPLPSDEVVELANDIANRSPPPSPAEAAGTLNFLSPGDWLAQPEEPIEWLVDDILPRASLTMLSAPPKAGKSTFARAMAMAVANGTRFLGKEVQQGSVLLLAIEEPERNVKTAYRKLGITGDTPLRIHFGRVSPNAATELSNVVRELRPALVVIDTIGRIRSGTLELNDYVSTGGWLEPLLYLAHETDACVCLLYHDTKAGRHAVGYDAIFSVLGSVGISATIDQLIGVRRKADDTRTYFTVGRYGDTPETVLGFDTETESLTALGTATQVTVGQLKSDILGALEAGDLKQSEVLEQVSSKSQHVLMALGQLCDVGAVEKTGSGKRGDPYFYAVVDDSPGKEYDPVSGMPEPKNSFFSAFPAPMQEKGKEKEMDGGGDQLADIDKPGRTRLKI